MPDMQSDPVYRIRVQKIVTLHFSEVARCRRCERVRLAASAVQLESSLEVLATLARRGHRGSVTRTVDAGRIDAGIVDAR
jgi:hypothetical protein